ncbi:MAG TPA: hypothetical protein VE890_15805 [Thermoguttaceae bacterium]|nr:hypothetical protein [Thermoguttaceae bacterium]
MSMNEPSFDQNFDQSFPPHRQGMSAAQKILLILGVLCGGMMVICCCGLGYMFYYAKGMVSEDPTVIASTSAEITEIDVPAEMEPQMAMNIKVPITGQEVMKAAVYVDPNNQGTLILGGVGQGIDQKNHADMQQQFTQALRQQGVKSGDQNIELEEIRTIERTIRGQPATFVINRGTDPESDKELFQVNGTFQGKSGPAIFLLIVDPEAYDEDRVVEIIESIK